MPGAIRDSGLDWNVQSLPHFLKATICECSKCCWQAGAMNEVEITTKSFFSLSLSASLSVLLLKMATASSAQLFREQRGTCTDVWHPERPHYGKYHVPYQNTMPGDRAEW